MKGLKEKYKTTIVPAMKEKFGYKNDLETPKMLKVVVNVGLSQWAKDAKFVETAENTLKRITGQKPVPRKSKKSISDFKIRKGQVIGLVVTLRGQRMYDFTQKLINLSLPRVRDFRGLSVRALDKDGNLSIGFREHIIFPEIRSDEVEKIHGLQVTIVTNAKKRVEALELFKMMSFPLK